MPTTVDCAYEVLWRKHIMVRSSLFCAVLLGLLVTTGSHQHDVQSHHDVDIVRFWNTSEFIWTTNTTVLARRACKVDIKVYISQTNITFTRSYLQKTHTSSEWNIKRYDGVFYNYTSHNKSQVPFDSVDITARQRYNAATEVLYYQSKDDMCAVFSVLATRGSTLIPSYDIRIKDSYIQKKSPNESECWGKFKEVSFGRKTRGLYDRRCRNVLDTKYPNPVDESKLPQ
uniref:Lipocalin n=1 Tax=Rhipicephalus appendiculatus TaxID=34631 RepID=A0A131Z3Y1_RHIAP